MWGVLFARALKGVWHEILGGNWFMKKTWIWKSRVRLLLKGCKLWQRPCNTILCTGGMFHWPHACFYWVYYIIFFIRNAKNNDRPSAFWTIRSLSSEISQTRNSELKLGHCNRANSKRIVEVIVIIIEWCIFQTIYPESVSKLQIKYHYVRWWYPFSSLFRNENFTFVLFCSLICETNVFHQVEEKQFIFDILIFQKQDGFVFPAINNSLS